MVQRPQHRPQPRPWLPDRPQQWSPAVSQLQTTRYKICEICEKYARLDFKLGRLGNVWPLFIQIFGLIFIHEMKEDFSRHYYFHVSERIFISVNIFCMDKCSYGQMFLWANFLGPKLTLFCPLFQDMYAGQATNQNELNSNLLKSQLAATVHSRSQSLSGLQPVIHIFTRFLNLYFSVFIWKLMRFWDRDTINLNLCRVEVWGLRWRLPQVWLRWIFQIRAT